MTRSVSDVFIETLVAAGVRRVYGVVGDSLNGITDVIRKNKDIDWLHVRHEEVAAFAAGAEAHVTGQLAVCAGSCGPGNLHLINGLYDCHRSRVPVLAIAAQIPSAEIGSGYFQETHPEHLFKDCSHYCELVSQPEQMPRVLGIAMRTAIAQARRRGRDPARRRRLAQVRVASRCRSASTAANRHASARRESLERRPRILNAATKVTILGGAGCAGAHAELIGSRRAPEGADRSRDARQGVHRVRQPLRRRHDRAARAFRRAITR